MSNYIPYIPDADELKYAPLRAKLFISASPLILAIGMKGSKGDGWRKTKLRIRKRTTSKAPDGRGVTKIEG